MVAVSVLPSSISSTTSSFTAPRSWRITRPTIRLRAEVRKAGPASARITKLEAISASAGRPTSRPRSSALSRVTMATMRTFGETSSCTSQFTAPGWTLDTLPLRALRALVFIARLQLSWPASPARLSPKRAASWPSSASMRRKAAISISPAGVTRAAPPAAPPGWATISGWSERLFSACTASQAPL